MSDTSTNSSSSKTKASIGNPKSSSKQATTCNSKPSPQRTKEDELNAEMTQILSEKGIVPKDGDNAAALVDLFKRTQAENAVLQKELAMYMKEDNTKRTNA